MIGKLHPDPIQGPMTVPWEVIGQVAPGALAAHIGKYPAPWSTQHRGNGHVDVIDGDGRVFAHVYCWDDKDSRSLERVIETTEITDARSKALALDRPEFHRMGEKNVAAMRLWADAEVRLELLTARSTLREMRDVASFVERSALDVAIRTISDALRREGR